MKKIKLFALAAFAMLSTNAFAQADETPVANNPGTWNDGSFQYTVVALTSKGEGAARKIEKATVSIEALNSLKTTTAVIIPPKVTYYVAAPEEPELGANIWDGSVDFKVVKITDMKKCEAMTSVTIPENVEEIAATAFQGLTSLESITLPTTVATIGNSAFEGCTSLGTFTVPTGSMLHTLGASSLKDTGLSSIDLSKAVNWYDPEDADKKPVGLSVINNIFNAPKNSLTSITLPAISYTIANNAFKGCKNLATVNNLSYATQIGENAFAGCALKGALSLPGVITIGANAFGSYNPGGGAAVLKNAITSVAFGAIDGTNNVAADAFTGSVITKVTYGDITYTAVTGGDDKIGLIATATFKNNTDITELNFGAISKKADGDYNVFPANAFSGMTALTTINITGKVTAAEVFASGIFTGATALTTVNYAVELTAAETVKPFNAAAFAADPVAPGADPAITLNTVERIMALYRATGEEVADYKLHNVIVTDAAVVAAGTIGQGTEGSKKMLQDCKNTSNYYYWFKPEANAAVKKVQENGAKVVVYSAYVDMSDYSVCMNPLALVNGQYVVPAGKVVIVKSSTVDAVPFFGAGAAASTIQTWGAGGDVDDFNLLRQATHKYTWGNILDDDALYNGEGTLFCWNNPENYGFSFTNLTEQHKGMAAKAIYICVEGTPEVAEAFARIKWLDEDGNVTAIQEVKKTNAETDAIYNIAGQKVGASYKGLVIKNGKKYIQK